MNGDAAMSNGFFRELRDRHVLRVGGLYLLISVPIMEAGDIILPRLGLGDGSLTVLLVLLAIGFPIALILAWTYEFTAEGVKPESEVVRTGETRGAAGRKVDFVIIGLLLAALAYLSWDKFLRADPGSTTDTPSIAVLPFVNMTNDESNEYFSDGMSEELLNALAKVPNLRVAGRTSSFYYKGRNEDLRSIGRNLGVDTVLEGSVRKDGERVRVTTQLINVSDGFHLWSETYDYTLESIFEVQDRIAHSVVDVLKVRLLGEAPPVSTRSTSSTVAHSSYLRGRYDLHRRTEASIIRATDFFSEAVESDPEYAAAWVGLAESLILQFVNHRTVSREEAIAGAREALDKALALDSHSAEAYAALGLLHMQTHEKTRAAAAFERALALDPNYSEAWHWYGLLDGEMGRFESGLRRLSKAVDLDPLHRVARTNLGQAMMMSGDWDGARRFFRRGIELEPEDPYGYVVLAGIESQKPWPQPRAALQLVAQALQYDPDNIEALRSKAELELELADVAGATATIRKMIERRPDHPQTVSAQLQLEVYTGGLAAAAAYLAQAVEQYGEQLGEQRDYFLALGQIMAGDAVQAADTWQMVYPGLFSPEPNIEKHSMSAATTVAYTLLQAGRPEQADAILAASDASSENRPRFGPAGYRLLDVESAALRGQTDLALERLQAAIDEGYRNRLVRGGFTLDRFPLFANLHGDARFQSIATMLHGYHEQVDDAVRD